MDPGDYAIYYHPDRPWMRATLDRVILPRDDRGPGVLEIKTTRTGNASEWETDPPLHYQIQLQHQMAVTGCEWGSLCVLIGGQQLVWCDLDRNDEFIAHLIDVESKWWWNVENGVLPDADGSDATAQALKKLYPEDDGDTATLPEDALGWWATIKDARARKKEADAVEREAMNKLRAAIGAATYGEVNGERWSYKTTQRKEAVVKASSFRVLRKCKGDSE